MNEVSSLAPTASIEALNLAERGVRVDFRWTGDRFSHTILGISEGKSVPLLESVEGVSEDSPALVELHQQDEAIFLTGACAAGHWSMSVEIADDRFILFDVACRLRTGMASVGSEYRGVLPGTRWVQSDRWGVGGFVEPLDDSNPPLAPPYEGGEFEAAAGETPYSVALGPISESRQGGCRVVCESDLQEICVSSADESPAIFPATVRWRYRVFVLGDEPAR